MKHFADLVQSLDQTRNPMAIQIALKSYFHQVEDDDRMSSISILGKNRPSRIVTTNQLWDWAVEMSGLPQWLVQKSTERIRDRCEAIALILPKAKSDGALTLSELVQKMDEVRNGSEEALKGFVTSSWQHCDHQEGYVFNKLITGGFRYSVPDKLVADALTEITGVPEKILIHRLSKSWKVDNPEFAGLVADHPDDKYSQPYAFCKIQSVPKIPVEEPVDQFLIERKWSGIRSQVIVRKGAFYLWSEDGQFINRHFPDFLPMKDLLPDGTVIEGVIIPGDEDRPGVRQELEARLSKVAVTRKFIRENPVAFMAYDLLEHQNKSHVNLSLEERRTVLESLIARPNMPGGLRISTLLKSQDWIKIQQERELARKYGCTGIVVKERGSSYSEFAWQSIAVTPFSIKAILLYAQPGEGTEGFTYKNFSLAVRDGKDLVPLVRLESGLSDGEHELITTFVKENTIERFGPVRSVKPKLVFTITFTEVLSNKRRKSGVVLKNPQLVAWCQDAPLDDADTLDSVHKLLLPDRWV